MVEVRPMTVDDIDAVGAVVRAAADDAERRAGREPEPVSDAELERFRAGTRRFVEHDPAGAWVAEADGTVVGMTESIRRGGFWGLSMLFVHPHRQGKHVGRRLLDATLDYAAGADVRMICASRDSRALRRYSRAGLSVHPALRAEGTPNPATIPADLPGRSGTERDLDLVETIDKGLRGSRAADVAFSLEHSGARMEVIDAAPGDGYVLHRENRVAMLGATDEQTASLLLWRVLAAATGTVSVHQLTAGQDWAVRVALAAGLPVTADGPLFVSGRDLPPRAWIPSGWYF
jgi:GNAT superfamily N-acetyltransferase